MAHDPHERKFEADLHYAFNGGVTADYAYLYVMSPREAHAIDDAASLAFVGRFGEAEQARIRGGYSGHGLIDNGAIAVESESTREAFRQMLDEDN